MTCQLQSKRRHSAQRARGRQAHRFFLARRNMHPQTNTPPSVCCSLRIMSVYKHASPLVVIFTVVTGFSINNRTPDEGFIVARLSSRSPSVIHVGHVRLDTVLS